MSERLIRTVTSPLRQAVFVLRASLRCYPLRGLQNLHRDTRLVYGCWYHHAAGILELVCIHMHVCYVCVCTCSCIRAVVVNYSITLITCIAHKKLWLLIQWLLVLDHYNFANFANFSLPYNEFIFMKYS